MKNNQFISWKDINITDGFWKKWQTLALEKTSHAIYDRFSETGRIDAMNLDWTPEKPERPHVFWDSDIAKWMEGTAYLLYHHPDADLSQKLEDIIAKIRKGQTEDGYFNSAILSLMPEKRFKDRTNHELYTAGHLIEAAVAHYEATGETYFLETMERFADCIERVFVTEQSAPYKTPGHQELELALVRLYHASGNERYLELSRHFVDQRGQDPNERVFSAPNGTFPAYPPLDNQLFYNDTYAQDDTPARQMHRAGGHAVRAMYFYTAMANIAYEYNDSALLEACSKLWDDAVNKKMYVTGGVSAERYGEAIGTDYVLPLDLSYAETCASVAMSNFSMAMFRLTHDGKYMDMIERQMYNGALVGLSMDGEAFFYDNAMLCRPKVTDFFSGVHALPLFPAYERQRVFNCSCCPPNIYRFLAVLGQYFYSTDETVENGTLYVHQYGTSDAKLQVNGQEITLSQVTEYPWDETVSITVHTENAADTDIALRIPAWCPHTVLSVNGTDTAIETEKGYMHIKRLWNDGDTITLRLSMPVTELYANPNVVEVTGRVALSRGPLVYCLEGCDQPSLNIFDVRLDREGQSFTLAEKEICGHNVTAIQGNAKISSTQEWENHLYLSKLPEYKDTAFTAVPYYCWANRCVNDMTVWIKKEC